MSKNLEVPLKVYQTCCLCEYKQKEFCKEGFFITTNRNLKNAWICSSCKEKKNVEIFSFRCYICDSEWIQVFEEHFYCNQCKTKNKLKV